MVVTVQDAIEAGRDSIDDGEVVERERWRVSREGNERKAFAIPEWGALPRLDGCSKGAVANP